MSTAEQHDNNVVSIGKPAVSVVMVTPEMARRWLGQNIKNRKIRKQKWMDYARDMASGRWTFDGAPLRFSADGRLLDGQHRCLAIIESGVTLPMVVVRGLPNDSQSVMDIGIKRTPADYLGMQAEGGDHKTATAIARSLILFTEARNPTVPQVVEFCETNAERLSTAAYYTRMCVASGLRGASIYGVAYYLLSDVDPDAATTFFRRLASGADLGKGNPILLLRNKFMQGTPSGHARDLASLRHNLAWIFRAWNHWRDGKTMQLLRVSATDHFPSPK